MLKTEILKLLSIKKKKVFKIKLINLKLNENKKIKIQKCSKVFLLFREVNILFQFFYYKRTVYSIFPMSFLNIRHPYSTKK